mmetsp:Transcript_11136/g.20893  ORF Transcript_11136/g.20893 Transcript_11136/m.20893 type:complete len:81 (-) Transcript_11136:54-296(-)
MRRATLACKQAPSVRLQGERRFAAPEVGAIRLAAALDSFSLRMVLTRMQHYFRPMKPWSGELHFSMLLATLSGRCVSKNH